MKKLSVTENTVVCKKGEQANSMYYVASGLLGVYLDYGDGKSTELARIGKGNFIGEMGVIEKQPRTADVVALENSELVEITAEDFPEFVKKNTTDVVRMMKSLSLRLRRTTEDLEMAARSVNAYVEDEQADEKLETAKVSGIVSLYRKLFTFLGKKESTPKDFYQAGEVICAQGEVANFMVRLLDGEVGIYRAYGTKDQEKVATLEAGAVIGEMALLEENRRSATVVAETNVKAEIVGKDRLNQYLNERPEEAMKILVNLSAKLRETNIAYVKTLNTLSEYVAKEREAMAGSPYLREFDVLINRYTSSEAFAAYDECRYSNIWD